MTKVETVEEFLARGGEIRRYPMWVHGEVKYKGVTVMGRARSRAADELRASTNKARSERKLGNASNFGGNLGETNLPVDVAFKKGLLF